MQILHIIITISFTGRVTSGYKIENVDSDPVWTLIGKQTPQIHQTFYPVANNVSISKGDMIVSIFFISFVRSDFNFSIYFFSIMTIIFFILPF